ncbi:Trp family transcriptional regulator [Desulfosediminicola ganghwensis]|uniref:Trp family transcriptional regulator n=1 Tax=Desulfosediminicola ganghwensis TaxID=2569540 RepID=UPI0010AB9B82|nr:Trp family transcriptional regulator [Desulfosediminicola ganghwensis]
MDTKIKNISSLVNYLLAKKNPEEMEQSLNELLTASELDEIVNRLQIIKMLKKGIPQRKIAEELGVGIATVTRGSNALKKSREK